MSVILFKITSTAIQGSSNEPESLFYVKSYKLQYSNNSVDWQKVKENGADKVNPSIISFKASAINLS